MPRRASSGISAGQILGLAAGVAFILVIGFVLVKVLMGGMGAGGGKESSTSSRITASNELNIQEYMENANALRGNSYWVRGRVEEQLKWTPTSGRLISLVVQQSNGSSPVAILVPQEFSHVNIEKGADLTFVVEVGEQGRLLAKNVKQS